MRVQALSDLHLEFGPLDLPIEYADVLVAAGDIGIGTAGHRWLQRLSCPVVYVAGNHEYWHHDLLELSLTLTEMSRHGNVHFLENRSIEIGTVRFVGCTLWTRFNDSDARVMRSVARVMNDFRYIAHGPRAARPQDLVRLNAASERWLERELAAPYPGKTVVVTHHAPLMQSWYLDRDEDMVRFAYCNDLHELMRRSSVDLWVHGHVHQASDYSAYGVRVVCNPRGYHNYREVSGFDPAKVISL